MGGMTWLRLLSYMVVIFWLSMMVLLINRSYLSREEAIREEVTEEAHRGEAVTGGQQEWLGIYFKGSKIGYAYRVVKRFNQGYFLREIAEMRMRLMEEPKQVSLLTAARLDDRFRLENFQFKMVSVDSQWLIRGKVVGDKMELAITVNRETTQQLIALKQRPQLPVNLMLYLTRREPLTVGKSYRVPFFDPTSLSNDVLTIRVRGKERLTLGGETLEAYKLEESFKGMTHYVWVRADGTILKEEMPLGITLIREGREEALRGLPSQEAQIDLISATAVEADRKLPHPRRLRYLKIRLRNVSLEDLPLSSGRQMLHDDTLEIRVEGLTPFLDIRLRSLRKGEGKGGWLAATPLVQADHPAIRDLARSILGREDRAVEAIRLLLQWINQNIDKQPTISLPNALEVLNSRVGDCNEHTVLFTALARAAGIPTKMVAGLVYHEGRFFYHAWAECRLGEGWLTVDPLLGQVPVDATHIKLVEGELDQQLGLLKVIGRLQVSILAFR